MAHAAAPRRRFRHHARRAVGIDQCGAALRRQEGHPIGDTQFSGETHQRVRSRKTTAGRTARNHHPNAGQPRRRVQQDVGSFQRLNATDKGDHLFAVGNAQSPPGGDTGAWCESLEVDTRMRDVDARRVGAMHRNQLVRFIFGVDNQPVGFVDHLLLADCAQRWLRGVAVGEGRVLDRGQRVGGVHQWHCPAVTARSWAASARRTWAVNAHS